jgi:hypothetical protein
VSANRCAPLGTNASAVSTIAKNCTIFKRTFMAPRFGNPLVNHARASGSELDGLDA